MDPFITGQQAYEFIGTIDLPHKNFICSDPCYEEGNNGYEAYKLPCREWDVWVLRMDCDDWGWRNARLILTRNGKRPVHEIKKGGILTEMIGVDSGSAGFFDIEAFGDRSEKYLQVPFYKYKGESNPDIRVMAAQEKWYRMCANRSLTGKHAGTVPNGTVSSAGIGDGCYELWEMNAGQAGKGFEQFESKEPVQFTLLFLSDTWLHG